MNTECNGSSSSSIEKKAAQINWSFFSSFIFTSVVRWLYVFIIGFEECLCFFFLSVLFLYAPNSTEGSQMQIFNDLAAVGSVERSETAKLQIYEYEFIKTEEEKNNNVNFMCSIRCDQRVAAIRARWFDPIELINGNLHQSITWNYRMYRSVSEIGNGTHTLADSVSI